MIDDTGSRSRSRAHAEQETSEEKRRFNMFMSGHFDASTLFKIGYRLQHHQHHMGSCIVIGLPCKKPAMPGLGRTCVKDTTWVLG